MAQHDNVIDNADGATVRADLNSLFEAIATLQSGSSAPSPTFAYMFWADTANTLLKQRNGANNAWITIGTLDATAWGLAALAANTFTGTQNLADNLLQRAKLKDYGESVGSVSSASNTLTLDCETQNNFYTTLTEDVSTLTISNWPASGTLGSITLEITQHASAAKTVTFTGVDFGGASAPDLTTVGSITTVVIWTRDGGTTKYGATAHQT